MKRHGIIANLLAIIGLIVVGWILYGMMNRVEKKLAFIIDSVEINGRDNLTVGENSDVCYDHVPQDFLTITQEPDCFKWQVNPGYKDSLQYFKINNVNPNKQTIYDSDKQVISLNLVTSKGDLLPIKFTGADVWRTWKNFRKQQDVLARQFATFYRFAQGNVSHEDSLLWLNQMQQRAVRSFFEYKETDYFPKGKTLVMVILDEHTTITAEKRLYDNTQEGDTIIKYARSGQTSTKGEQNRCCKVQFFDVSDHCYKENIPEKDYFNIDGVNYVMKPSVKLTAWGAGHVMIKNCGNKGNKKLSLHYPRPIIFVASVDSLRKKSLLSSGLITLKQNNYSFPTQSDLYLPAFSRAINYDLCNLEFSHNVDTVKVRDNNFNVSVVHENIFSLKNLKSSIIPTFEKINILSGDDILKCRVGYIGQRFIRSYFYLPLIVLLVLLCLVWWPWYPRYSPLRPSDHYIYNYEQVKHFRLFTTILLLICMLYCVCKSLVALKLSYTFPYFEKITGIIPASTALMMLLFFCMAMVLNTKLLKQKSRANYINLIACSLLFLTICYVFFYVIDPAISQGVKNSYFNSEITIYSNPKEWLEAVGINDTHRSVVYSLIAVETIMLLVWFLLNIWEKARFLIKQFVENNTKWSIKNIELNGTKVTQQLSENLSLFITSHPKSAKWASIIFRAFLIMATWLVVWKLFLVINWTHLWSISFSRKIILILLALILTLLALSFLFSFVYDAFCKTLRLLFPWHMLLLIALVLLGKMLGNFATAFITLSVIIGLCNALSCVVESINHDQNGRNAVPRHEVFLQMLFITLFYIVGAMVGDNGYLTNYLGFFLCIFVFFFIVKRPYINNTADNERETERERIWPPILVSVLVVYIVALPLLSSMFFSPERVNYSRMSRRVMLYSNFNELQKSGYRYSESDAEFMVIMSHYMQQKQTSDPLSNDTHFLHASVSSGQSPVVLNDLSVPIAFFGSYGLMSTTSVYFLLLLLLIGVVMYYSLNYEDEVSSKLTRAMQWRLLAVFMWVGTSLYIYFSYIDWLPFTGRLNPGFGVDSVGEALETAFLLAFMTTITYKEE